MTRGRFFFQGTFRSLYLRGIGIIIIMIAVTTTTTTAAAAVVVVVVVVVRSFRCYIERTIL